MRSALTIALLTAAAVLPEAALGQAKDAGADNSVRVTMSLNNDGSRTVYEFDTANRKATATTTNAAGKAQGKIRYTLDEAGRFATGEIYDADERLRFKTVYTYDAAGRLKEETRLSTRDVVQHKLVYSYDAQGKQTGYSVVDASGKLLGQTSPVSNTPRKAAPKKSK